MLMDWLEPSIEKRIDIATDACDNNLEVNELYDKIIGYCGEWKITCSDQHDLKNNDIEIAINAMTRKLIEASYRMGFKDGLGVKEDIRKCL